MVGNGYTVKAAVIEMKMVAEGMTGAKGINEMNKKFKVDIPIADAVYRILHERMSPVLEMRLLSDNLGSVLSRLNIKVMVALIFMGASSLCMGRKHFPHTPHDVEFLPNEGQWDDFVQYRANLSSGVFWMEKAGWTAWIAGEGYDELWAHEDLNGDGMPELLKSHAWKVEFVGGNEGSLKSGSNELGYKVNYYRGNDPTKWVTGIDPVSTLNYEGFGLKVNLRMDGTARGSQRLKYDWVVKPGGNPNDIVVRHEGTVVEAKDDGSLVHYMGETGEIVEGAPFAFQLIGTRFVEVDCEYKVKHKKDGATEVRFKVGDYDEDYDLVIDPDIVFATYIGATQANWGLHGWL